MNDRPGGESAPATDDPPATQRSESDPSEFDQSTRDGSGRNWPDTWIRWRYPLALLALVLTIAMTPAAGRVRMDRSIRGLFAIDDPVAVQYDEFNRHLPTRPVVMLVYDDAELNSLAGLQRNQRLTDAVADVPGVAGVLSVAKLNTIVGRMRPLSADPVLFRVDHRVSVGFQSMFAGYTHGENQTIAAVVAMLDVGQAESAVTALRRLSADWDHDAGHIAPVGEPVLIDDAFGLIQRDGTRLAWTVLGVLSLVVLVGTGDFRAALLVAATIGGTVSGTNATMGWLAIPQTLISTVLTAILTIVIVAAVLHLTIATHRRHYKGRTASVSQAIGDLWHPIFWTTATTAGGFVALTASDIRPVVSFGISVAIGCTWALIFLALWTPAILTLPSVRLAHRGNFGRRWRRSLSLVGRRLAAASIRFRVVVVTATLVAGTASIYGLTGGEVDSNFLSNFRPDSDIVQAYTDVEERLGGAGVWDVLLPAPDILDEAYLADVRELEREIRDIRVDGFSIAKVLSLADADRVAMEAPLMRLVSPEVRLGLMRSSLPVFYDALVTPGNDRPNSSEEVESDERSHSSQGQSSQSQSSQGQSSQGDSTQGGRGRWLRLMMRTNETVPSEVKLQLIDGVTVAANAFVDRGLSRQNDGAVRRPIVSGYHVLMSNLVGSVIADQWRCFLASILVVAVMLGLTLRNFWLVAAALVANLTPVLIVLAASMWWGRRLNMGAAMIAAVSIGLSIDGSVHLLLRRRRLMRAGNENRHPNRFGSRTATLSAAAGVGLPLVLATVGLIAGFATLISSEFVPTATMGRLIAWTLAAAAVANLIVLPGLVGGGGRISNAAAKTQST